MKAGTLLVMPQSCPSVKTRTPRAIWVLLPESPAMNTNQKLFLNKNKQTNIKKNPKHIQTKRYLEDTNSDLV